MPLSGHAIETCEGTGNRNGHHPTNRVGGRYLDLDLDLDVDVDVDVDVLAVPAGVGVADQRQVGVGAEGLEEGVIELGRGVPIGRKCRLAFRTGIKGRGRCPSRPVDLLARNAIPSPSSP